MIGWRWFRAGRVAGIATSVACAGCGSSPGGEPFSGALSVELTSVPFPYDSVARADLFVVRVEAMLRDIDSTEAARAADAGGNKDPEKGFVTVVVPNTSFNLQDLQRGARVPLGSTNLPVGTYLGFRLILSSDESSVTLQNGAVLTGTTTPGIQWPNVGRNGVKIALDGPIDVPLEGTRMVVVFDPRRILPLRAGSISQNGLLFRPPLRGAVVDSTGSLSGTVRRDNSSGPTVSEAVVEVLRLNTTVNDADPANIVQSSRTDGGGNFKFFFLTPGAYALRASPPPALPQYHAALEPVLTVAPSVTADGNLLVLGQN